MAAMAPRQAHTPWARRLLIAGLLVAGMASFPIVRADDTEHEPMYALHARSDRIRQVSGSLLPKVHAAAAEHVGLLAWYARHPAEAAAELGGGGAGFGLLPQIVSLLSLLADDGLEHHTPPLPPLPPPLATDSTGGAATTGATRAGAAAGASSPQGAVGTECSADDQALAAGSARAVLAAQRAAQCAGPTMGPPAAAAGLNETLPWHDFVVVVASAPGHADYRAAMRSGWLEPAGRA